MKYQIHAICLLLNEEPFVKPMLEGIYPFCRSISVITQYDRDYYGNPVQPDQSVQNVLNYPDPEGKIHLVIRKYKDEAAARNHEMLSILQDPSKKIKSHGVPHVEIRRFHQKPDYFFILDGDEIYDPSDMERILSYLYAKKPRGMRVTGYQYHFTWNRRIPLQVIHHNHFGFLQPGIFFEQRRRVSWNELRINTLGSKLGLHRLGSGLLNYIDCPPEIGIFHHGAYLGGAERLKEKFQKHSHQEVNNDDYIKKIEKMSYNMIDIIDLPKIIRSSQWPSSFWENQKNDT